MFVDQVTIYVRGGDGGAGVAAFHRMKGRPRGKPDGGSGGAGGDVLIEADDSVASLLAYQRRPHHRAGSGTHGEGDLRHGRRGEDVVLTVPQGTTVRTADGAMLADLVQAGQRVLVARGGRPGRGNAALVDPRHKVPAFAEQGEYGEEVELVLELKLMADAALIGYPNAGKSSLISRVSAARPKIAEYPFTTLQPHLGVVDIDGRDFVLADIPGLIEGAAAGRGLGHEFLRHTERARALVLLLDPSPLQADSPIEQHSVLLHELGHHSADLAGRVKVVAVNKIDLAETADRLPELEDWANEEGIRLFPVSALTGAGIEPLMYAIADAVETERRLGPEREGYVLHRPAPAGYRLRRQGTEWIVEGKAVERAVALDDLTTPEAADFVADRLASLGVNRRLAEAGATAGDDVRIGDLVFEYQPDDQDPGPA